MISSKIIVLLQCVFHGIRLLRLIKIGCRETINFFVLTFWRCEQEAEGAGVGQVCTKDSTLEKIQKMRVASIKKTYGF